MGIGHYLLGDAHGVVVLNGDHRFVFQVDGGLGAEQLVEP